jgi:hypothetical protein
VHLLQTLLQAIQLQIPHLTPLKIHPQILLATQRKTPPLRIQPQILLRIRHQTQLKILHKTILKSYQATRNVRKQRLRD